MSKLNAGQKNILRLIDKDSNSEGWTSVSDILFPHVSTNMPKELIILKGDKGSYQAKLTDEGVSIIHAMNWL